MANWTDKGTKSRQNLRHFMKFAQDPRIDHNDRLADLSANNLNMTQVRSWNDGLQIGRFG